MLDLNFTFLDDDSLELLESDDRARFSYVDLLAFLHDLLVPFATATERPRFSASDIFRRLADVQHAFSSHLQIGSAARVNIAVAEAFHSELGRNYFQPSAKNPSKAQQAVDAFLADLLQQYNLIRVIRSRGGVRRVA